MKRDDLSNRTNSSFSQATVLWPRGIHHKAVIYPLGATDVETEAIRGLLEDALNGEKKKGFLRKLISPGHTTTGDNAASHR